MPFDLEYYNLFLRNQGDLYCIRLKDGKTLKGVPGVASNVNPMSHDAVFFVDFDDSPRRAFYWRDFIDAKKISLPTSQAAANSANTSAGVSAKAEKPGISTKCANQSPSSS